LHTLRAIRRYKTLLLASYSQKLLNYSVSSSPNVFFCGSFDFVGHVSNFARWLFLIGLYFDCLALTFSNLSVHFSVINEIRSKFAEFALSFLTFIVFA